jgi:ubiquinone/menaquinone biosynthesis C-methylase UbiE
MTTSNNNATVTRSVSFQQMRRLIQGRRLSRLAHNPANVQFIRDACRQIELGLGAAVIDVGCGPLGALTTLAEVVGPTGRVVGLDHNQDVLSLAEQTVQRGGLDQVTLINADINEPGTLERLGPWEFDAAYCRLVLVNQADPTATLRRMAALVRPGGHIIAHELLFESAYPVFDPPVPAFSRVLELTQACMQIQGKHTDVARHFQTIARAAGFRDIQQRGLFDATPSSAPDFIQEQGVGLLMVFRQSLLNTGLASQAEFLELLQALKAATTVSYQTFFSWIFVEMIAQVPEDDEQSGQVNTP